MKTEVDNYRGYEIRFDTEKETFECDIDDSRSVKKSYSAIKLFIDEFIKDNNIFKPFKVMKNPLGYMGGKVGKIIGIRKDRRFIMETDGGTKEQISDYNEDDYWVITDNLIERLKEIEPKLIEQGQLTLKIKKVDADIKAFYEALNTTNLKQHKRTLLNEF